MKLEMPIMEVDESKQLVKRLLKTQCRACGKAYFIIRPACPFCGHPSDNNFDVERLKQEIENSHLIKENRKIILMRALTNHNRAQFMFAVRPINEAAFIDILRIIQRGLDFKQRW